MFSFLYTIFERVKYALKGDYNFSTPVPKSDKDFWKGLSCKVGDLECIIHDRTKLLISYNGKLLGRYINGEMIPVEDLNPKIINWYKDCGFEIV